MTNKTLIEFARTQLKEMLVKCNIDQQMIFKRMYSHKNLNVDINYVVDNMNPDNLDWAMTQVERTINK